LYFRDPLRSSLKPLPSVDSDISSPMRGTSGGASRGFLGSDRSHCIKMQSPLKDCPKVRIAPSESSNSSGRVQILRYASVGMKEPVSTRRTASIGSQLQHGEVV